jgi:putative ABC transport system ATP-binding protein
VAGILLPVAGAVQVGETTVSQLDDTARRKFRSREIGQVFQAFELLEYLTIYENILLGSIIDSSVDEAVRQRALALLRSVGLDDKMHTKPARLSHGERQRAAVCRAMLNRPGLLLADEPTGNLDQANKQNVVDLLVRQARERGSTLLMVTHDHGLLSSFERVVDLNKLTRVTA